MAKQRLELTWIGKENRPRLEPRILLEDRVVSYHAQHRVSEKDIFDNRLIYGDNLLALKALEQEFTGKIKCVFIDPPYNTGSAFTHYDDGIEHSLWLSLIRDRLEIIRRLLTDDGTVWITIDDNESHYLKVLCDEIFGRINFVANVVWQKKFSPQNDAKWLSDMHDHILVFAKNKLSFKPNLLPRSLKQEKNFKNPDNDPRGPWASGDYTCAKSKHERPNLYYPIRNPYNGIEVWPKQTRVWAFDEAATKENVKDNLLWWGSKGQNPVPRLKKFPNVVRQGTVPGTVWLHQDVGNNQDARREVLSFNPNEPFSTPKPESLIQQILSIATNKADIVLDSFAGSGTTGAVAHKMGRRWIMVELGEHCHTHIIPRLKKVIDGSDNGGITEAENWKGGGGFRYFKLAPSLLQKDHFGNWVISKEYNPAMLSEAICKLEGFRYEPSDSVYWQQGQSTETDFIYVTTQTLNREQIAKLSEEVGTKRTLLVMCCAFRCKNVSDFPNLTVKKIPKAVLDTCEWGKDDYSLEIKNLPTMTSGQSDDPEQFKNTRETRKARQRKQEPSLFDKVS
jgi:adenine-specific DNA-methyltransferase